MFSQECIVIIRSSLATMGEHVVRRFFNNVLAIIREISVEPAYLGMALSWGLYGIVSSELYIDKVRTGSLCSTGISYYLGPYLKILHETDILSQVCKVNLALGDEICNNIQGLDHSF